MEVHPVWMDLSSGTKRTSARLHASVLSLEERAATSAQMKRAEFVREGERLRRQVEKLEKERPLGAPCRKNGWTHGLGDLDQYEKTLQEERHADKMNLQRQLGNVHSGLKKFQRQLLDVKPSPDLIEKLKEIMTEVENSINTFKEDQRLRFEELLKEERTCVQEMSALEKKMENWSLVVRSEPRVMPASTVKAARPPDVEVPSEVSALESFLQRTGGPDGGWDQYDHQAFLNVWTKHGGRAAYRREAKLYLPSRSLEEIERHEDWYLELVHLQDLKREAIQRWKSRRQKERQARIHSQEEVEEERRRGREGQQHRAEEERSEAAQRLGEWREHRRRREELEEEKRLAEEVHQRRQAKEVRRRQVEVKLTLEEQLRLRREEQEEQERKRREEEQRDTEERRREAAVGIKRFQERDLHKVVTKVKESQQREQEETERRERLAAKMKEKAEGNITRDRSRLTRPTKGWEARTKHPGPTGEGGPVLHMFHRAVPSWRQGL